MAPTDSVRRLLVTDRVEVVDGRKQPPDRVLGFHLKVCLVANQIDTRHHNGRITMSYTVFREHADDVLRIAKDLGLTVQEIEFVDGEECYPYLLGQAGSGWERVVN